MLFAGVDPGSESYAFSIINEVGNQVSYFEIPTQSIPHYSLSAVRRLLDYKPYCIALPSGHGLPLVRGNQLNDEYIALLTLSKSKEGPLHSILNAFRFMIINSFTIPSVVEIESVPIYRKIWIDMGTADKVASAFFYRAYLSLSDFVLLEMGRHFSSIMVVKDGKIIDGFGGTVIPGLASPGAIDGEVVYLLNKAGISVDKETIYSGSNEERSIEILEMISSSLAHKYDSKIIVSGPAKDKISIGEKMNLPFKEAAIGSAMIASGICGYAYRDYIDMLKSNGNPVSFMRLKGWDEVVSWIKTL
ncbi:hypothetical protein IC006_1841 [Sulfuracidifex tepidarius]|uniref:Butyrate kinase n=2 Tax=Sulfuracidifex tepidarius TaxID=1294262 RepID=A0A510DWE0_9CREN|nr:hypothetical protein IC006_1841 [Sulfuracidifex tepidarius]BBG27274.1 hypothetical protein IC007_1818 [Sulfuracidifex tepidarius]